MKKFILTMLMLVVGLITWAEIQIKDGQKVAFLGDSITYYGTAVPAGYCKLVESALKQQNLNVEMIFSGISGHKSNQMLARLDADVLAAKPDWMLLSCGVNDVWHGENGVPLPEYKQNITAIIDQAQAAGTKVIVLAATMIFEDAANDNNRKLDEYNAFLKQIAAEKQCIFVDLNTVMKQYIANAVANGRTAGTLLTIDGVHMNPLGNMMMATEILKNVGFDDAQLTAVQQLCQQIPDAWTINARTGITIQQYQKLDELAAKNGISVQEQLNRLIQQDIAEL